MRKFVSIGPSVLVIIAVLMILTLGPAAMRRMQLAHTQARVVLAQNRLDSDNLLDALSRANREVAESVLPSVVHIETETTLADLHEPSESVDENGEPIESPHSEPQRRTYRPVISSGAGWLWDDHGTVITNAHVVGESSTIKVELYDGRVREAEVVGKDPHTDIAVIHIDVGTTIPVRRATGEAVAIGDRVFAFGSPFGIKFSMSQGIVSGLGRGGDAAGMLGLRSGYTNFIQTDAAMNPGNSGGPLVDSRGRVIGMATAIANNATQNFGPGTPPVQGQSAGIGFAIPLETVEAVVSQLLDSDVVLRGYLGIQPMFSRSNEETARRTGYEGAGVLVGEVRDGEPAADGGLRTGDVIVEIDGRPTPTFDVLRSIISVAGPGKKIGIKFWRDRAFQNTTVTLGAAYSSGHGFRSTLNYIPGSEHMTKEQLRQWLSEYRPKELP